MARRPTRTPARKDDYEDHGPPILLWSASAVLFILTALPYLLGNALIELEVLAAQPFLRLILLVLAVAVAALAILRKEIPIAILHKGFRTVSAEVIKVSNSDHRGLHVVLESAR